MSSTSPTSRHLGLVYSSFRKNPVLWIAILGALVTSFIVHPDRKYFDYFDFKTLTCLFCVLAVVNALRNIHFFELLARRIVQMFGTTRMCILGLVYITFIGSMLIANDMALLTFLPLGYFVLTCTNKTRYMAFTFIMQNIAANLGGMLTPFGNPQNLYIYNKFNIPNLDFIIIMFPPFALSVVLITVCCLMVRSEPMKIEDEKLPLMSIRRTVIYLLLFALSIIIIFRGIPYGVGLVVVPALLAVFDRKALRMVDYPLLLTFVSFFVFSGNMARIDLVREFFAGLLHQNTLLFSVLSCQIISNVPSAILLSQFTSDYAPLLVGVNIGGVGTLVASLASLITFREYLKHNPGRTLRYLVQFSALNFGFLIVLIIFCEMFMF